MDQLNQETGRPPTPELPGHHQLCAQSHSQLHDLPVETVTEKADVSQAGWEMWVADDHFNQCARSPSPTGGPNLLTPDHKRRHSSRRTSRSTRAARLSHLSPNKHPSSSPPRPEDSSSHPNNTITGTLSSHYTNNHFQHSQHPSQLDLKSQRPHSQTIARPIATATGDREDRTVDPPRTEDRRLLLPLSTPGNHFSTHKTDPAVTPAPFASGQPYSHPVPTLTTTRPSGPVSPIPEQEAPLESVPTPAAIPGSPPCPSDPVSSPPRAAGPPESPRVIILNRSLSSPSSIKIKSEKIPLAFYPPGHDNTTPVRNPQPVLMDDASDPASRALPPTPLAQPQSPAQLGTNHHTLDDSSYTSQSAQITNTTNSTPTPQKLPTRASDGSPYAYAYEVRGRHVSRVDPQPLVHSPPTQPTMSTPEPQQPTLKKSMPTSSPKPITAPSPQLQQPPAEICVECMMRDRDMADVDVTGPGVWARKSDRDFEEAMAEEALMDEEESGEYTRDETLQSCPTSSASLHHLHNQSLSKTNTHNGLVALARARRGSGSRDSSLHNGLGGTDSVGSSGGHHHSRVSQARKKRLGRGNPLTSHALKAWTQMNPPAASHRWKTLQAYLKEQRHYLELEYQAKVKSRLESERTEKRIRSSLETISAVAISKRQSSTPPIQILETTDLLCGPTKGRRVTPNGHEYNFLNTVPRSIRSMNGTGNRSRSMAGPSTTVLSNGMVIETLDVSKDEKEADKFYEAKQARASCNPRLSSSSINNRNNNGFSHSPASSLPYSSYRHSTDLLQSSPAQQSSHLNHPSSPSTRAPSPSRFSVASRRSGIAESISRPFSSAWTRNRASGSQSVFSFAPSGSMIEMHVGLSQDRHHQYLSGTASPIIGVHNDTLTSIYNQSGAIRHSTLHASRPELMVHLTNQSDPTELYGPVAPSEHHRKDKKKLKKTLKSLLVKLGLGSRHASTNQLDQTDPNRPDVLRGPHSSANGRIRQQTDDEPLAPPPSLSLLAREQQNNRRNQSALSLPLSTAARIETDGRSRTSIGQRQSKYRPQSISNLIRQPGFESGMSSPISQFGLNSPRTNTYQINGRSSTHLSRSPSGYNNSNSPENLEAEELTMTSAQLLTGNRRKGLGSNEGSPDEGEITPEEERRTSRSRSTSSVVQPRTPSGGIMRSRVAEETGEKSEDEGGHGLGSRGSVKTVMSRSSKFKDMINHKLKGSHKDNETARKENEVDGDDRSRRRSTSLMMMVDPNQADPMDPQHQSRVRDYIPIEKSRYGVSRSSDFLALRYLTVGAKND